MSVLMMRRASEISRRRDALRARREQASRALPEWVVMPLKEAGMSASEIEAVLQRQAAAETEADIEEIDAEIEQLDGELDRIETRLLASPSAGLDGVRALLHLALGRIRTSGGENSLLYQSGRVRFLDLLERAAEELGIILVGDQRLAG